MVREKTKFMCAHSPLLTLETTQRNIEKSFFGTDAIPTYNVSRPIGDDLINIYNNIMMMNNYNSIIIITVMTFSSLFILLLLLC